MTPASPGRPSRAGAKPAKGSFDVAVVGRGAVGTAAALGFARAGRRVALVAPGEEGTARTANAAPARSPDDWDTRVFAISPASRALLLELGAWQLMDTSRIAPVHDMRLFNDATGLVTRQRAEVRLDAYQGRVEALAWIVENRELQQALDRAIALSLPAGMLTRVDAAVSELALPPRDVEPAPEAVLGLEGGGRLTAGLVIAADGTGSPLRLLAGIEHELRDYDQTAIVANFRTGKPHRDCAWQWFRDDGVMALLPLPAEDLPHGEGRVSLVWSAPSDRAAAFLDGEADDASGRLAREVQVMSHGELGSLAPISAPAGFPLRAVHCRRFIAPSFVLVGDAAHAVHPMAGQGMNLGFGDVRALMDALPADSAKPRRPDWLQLRRYERARREPVAVMQLALDGLQQAFGNLPAPLVGLRDLGWEVVARSSWIRRRMIAHAVS